MQHRKLEIELDLEQPLLDGISTISERLGTTPPVLIETLLTAFVQASKTDPELIAQFSKTASDRQKTALDN